MLSLLIGGLIAIVVQPRAVSASEYMVVVNGSASVDSISQAELKKILIAQTSSWPDGTKVTLVLPPKGSPEMQWLSEGLLGMSEKAYRRGLLEKAFRGALDNLVESSSAAQAEQEVGQTVGAVTAIPISTALGAVKELKIQ